MRGIKKLVLLLLVCTTIVGTSPNKTNPTLITLKWKSSELLSESEGKKPFERLKPSNLRDVWTNIWPDRRIKHHYIEDLNFEIYQVDENTFEVLGSPLSRAIDESEKTK